MHEDLAGPAMQYSFGLHSSVDLLEYICAGNLGPRLNMFKTYMPNVFECLIHWGKTERSPREDGCEGVETDL